MTQQEKRCDECGQTFHSDQELRDHNQRQHQGQAGQKGQMGHSKEEQPPRRKSA